MSKKIGIIVGLLVAILLAGLIACDWTNSAVFELQEGEAEKLGVVFPEGKKEFAKLYDQYEREEKYEELIVMAKKIVELSPKENREDAYLGLESAYAKAGRYEEALVVNEKLIKMRDKAGEIDCHEVMGRAQLLEWMNKQDEAIKVLEKYRQDCPEHAENLIPRLKEAISKGEKAFPTLKQLLQLESK